MDRKDKFAVRSLQPKTVSSNCLEMVAPGDQDHLVALLEEPPPIVPPTAPAP